MPAFTMKWDDFGGGFYVGQNESKQPRSTFTGYNVNVAAHDGAAVPANQVWQVPIGTLAGSGVTISNNSVHIDNSSGGQNMRIIDTVMSNNTAYTMLHRVVGGNHEVLGANIIYDPTPSDTRKLAVTNAIAASGGWQSVAGLPSNLCIAENNAYFVAGTNLYVLTSGGTATLVTSLSISGGSNGKLAVYGDRLVYAAGNLLVFSDALNFASWPSLNYIQIGSYSTTTEALIARYDDLVWFRSDSVYSIYGTLGFNAATRKISEGLDVTSIVSVGYASDENIVTSDNVIYYIDDSVIPYTSNIQMLYGNQSKTLAYQNMGISMRNETARYATRPSLVSTSARCLVSMWPLYGTGQAGFEALIRKKDKTFVKIKQSPLTYTPGTSNASDYAIRWAAAKDYATQYAGYYNNVFITQYATYKNPSTNSITKATLSFGIWQPEQTNAAFLPGPPSGSGSSSTTNTATPGLLELSPVETEVESKIKRVYVEAELNLDFYNLNDFRGTAYIKSFVENRAVDDVSFVNGVDYVSSQMLYSVDLTTVNSLTSQAINGAWNPSQPYNSTNDKKRASVTRILRFDPTDSGYGYKHYVSFEFQGFRIKRVWVEGETR